MTMLEQKINTLKENLLAMAGIVEDMVSKSIRALVERDVSLAGEVIDVEEHKVNRLEVENEDAAINLIALHQPEASNLRTITMVIKLNNDLERIGDHAVNIAQAALYLAPRRAVKPPADLPRMAAAATAMLRDGLNAFTDSNVELARDVCVRDAEVDELENRMNRELAAEMALDPSAIDRALKLVVVGLNLERVADLATNIAEEAIYLASGKTIKHCGRQEEPGSERPER